MKKLFVMLFVATSLLAVSCKKDTTVKLAKTEWQATLTQPGFNGVYDMVFETDSTGFMEIDLSGDVDNESFDETFTYTFDGKSNGVLTIEEDIHEPFTYDGAAKTITVMLDKEQVEEMGVDRIVFHQH